ncbi:hypothetical protein [Paraburkholderia sp. J12]|uniref:hypothetical protein n=1 Tax=Paraburkholderia sp. J12 TaxID=2805432 RepID=UPI002ABE301B|nr:hypothetical protein [Paraburkholderia sp. J12]
MAFERGEVVEFLRPVWVGGELMAKGDLVELPEREARDLKARRIAREPAEKGARGAAKGKGA